MGWRLEIQPRDMPKIVQEFDDEGEANYAFRQARRMTDPEPEAIELFETDDTGSNHRRVGKYDWRD